MPTLIKIRNSKSEIRRLAGYTLIEFLIVISILALSVGSVLLFLTTTLKGANQANVTSEVKQNGQGVLDNLQTQVRSSSKADVFSSGQLSSVSSNAISGLFLTLSTGEKLNIVCVNAAGSSNGYITVSKRPTTDTLPDPTPSNYQVVTNTDPVSGVDIVCTASSFQVNTNKNLVIINFVANQGKQAPSRADFLANAQFQTTIGLRTY